MHDYEAGPYIVIERRRGGLGPFLVGAAAGALLGVLIAPRPGAQTQREIREGVRRVRTAAEEGLEATRSTVHRTRERMVQGYQTVRSEVDTRAEQARSALETGRRAALDTREELEKQATRIRETYHTAAAKIGLEDESTPVGGVGRTFDVIVTDVFVELPEERPSAE